MPTCKICGKTYTFYLSLVDHLELEHDMKQKKIDEYFIDRIEEVVFKVKV